MSEPQLNCVDMSKWGGELTVPEAQCMWEAGVRHLIVGTGHPNGAGQWAKQQASTWLALFGDVGGTCDAYIYLYMAGSATEQTVTAIATMLGVDIRAWWLDAEDTESPHLTPAQRAAFLNGCLTVLGESRRRGIYTGRWWWVPMMANSSAFAHLPLWNSYYDGDPDTDGLPYGGWTDSAIEQYQGTTDLCGQSVDLNFAKDLDQEDEPMTPAERTEFEDLLIATFTADGENAIPREQKLVNARERMRARVAGETMPVLGRLESHTHQNGGTFTGSISLGSTFPPTPPL